MNLRYELDFARRMAVAAGENAKSMRAGGIQAEAKADASPVTAADRSNERLIAEAIRREFPDDGVLGEEGSSDAGRSGRRWIIDPIDGTRDFVRGNRFWCVLIALEGGGESQVGVAHFPMLGETYWAARGSGSYRNGEPLAASTVSSIEACCFSPCGLHVEAARPHMAVVVETMQRSWSMRSFGGALDACMVASGQVDLWFEPKVEPWDLAALKIIVEEAGGRFFAMDGSRRIDRGSAIACSPGLEIAARELFVRA